ncbi:MAG: hypothetical protein IJP02_04345 [Oscillospiraceae bacterium]|nr:hypothetical protein [Oscillospiraceae bacterium]
MDANKRTRVAILIAIIMVAAVFGSFGYSLYTIRSARVTLPGQTPDTSVTDPTYHEQVHRVEVTPDTVQAVIASLSRPESYYRQLSVHTFWPGGSGSMTSQCWVDSGHSMIRTILPTGQVRYALSHNGKLYYWYSGSTKYLTAPKSTLDPDLAQRIPTYEDVLTLDKQSISDAGYMAYGDHLCIYAETIQDELGYAERYWVSVDTGLLVAAETVKDGQTVYSVNATSPIQAPCPTSVRFALPDGTVLHQT